MGDLIRDQDRLATDEGADGRKKGVAWGDAVRLEEQSVCYSYKLKHAKKKDDRMYNLSKVVGYGGQKTVHRST